MDQLKSGLRIWLQITDWVFKIFLVRVLSGNRKMALESQTVWRVFFILLLFLMKTSTERDAISFAEGFSIVAIVLIISIKYMETALH